MRILRAILGRIFRRRVNWDNLDYGKSIFTDEEWERINGEL